MAVNISIPQARARLKTLPENLQSVLFSAQTAEIIYRIGEQNHLPEEKISEIAKAAGSAILGFIHIEELAKEIQDLAQLPLETAKSIAASLENRILNSIRSDLEKIYAPAPAEPEKPEEAKKPAPPAAPPAQFGGPPAPSKPAGPAPKPFIDLSSLTSKIKPAAPSVPPTIPKAPKPPAPITGAGGDKSAPQAPKVPPAPLPTTSAIPKAPPAPPPATPPAPAPVFLKRKLELEPLKPDMGVRIEQTTQFGAGRTPVPQPPKPARLEIGRLTPTKTTEPPKPVRTEMAPPRVVHYSEWRTPNISTPPQETVGGATPAPPKPPLPQVEKTTSELKELKPSVSPPPPPERIPPTSLQSSAPPPPPPPPPPK
jgi:hypothetical protein